MNARRLLPKRLRSHLRAAREIPRLAPLAADAATLRSLYRLECSTARWPPSQGRVPLRLRPLSGATVGVRPRTADLYALRETFLGRYHVPPARPGGPSVRRIWDLGANIGLTAAHLAVLFPDASVLAVEMDDGNADLCRSNLRSWPGRCEVVEAAVWATDGEIEYERADRDEQSFRAQPAGSTADGARRARSVALNTLLEREGPGAGVDVVKMDIEGAEQRVLTENTEWAERVGVIMVEVHEPYDVERCRHDLDVLGFETTIDDRHWAAVLGVRA